MPAPRSLRSRIITLVVATVLVAAAAVAFTLLRFRGIDASLRGLEQANAVSNALLRAGVDLAQERGLTNAALLAPAPAPRDAVTAILARRESADAQLAAGVAAIRRAGLEESPAVHAAFAEFSSAQQAHARRREQALRDLYRPREGRDPALATEWFPAFNAYVGAVGALRETVVAQLALSGDGSNLEALKAALARAIESLGRERGYTRGFLAQGVAMTDADFRVLAEFQGALDSALEQIRVLQTGRTLSPEADLVLRGALSRYQNVFLDLRARVREAGRAGGPYPISGDEWWEAGTATIEAFVAAFERAVESTDRLARGARSSALQEVFRVSGVLAALLLGTLVLLAVVLGTLARRVGVVAGRLRAITGADGPSGAPEGKKDGDEFAVLTRAADDLQAAVAAREAALRSKGDFLLNMSHDLRSPLNGVRGFAELLRETDGAAADPAVREYAGYIEESADTLLGLVNRILDFARSSSGTLRLDEAEVELQDLVEKSFSQNHALAERKSLRLRFGGEIPAVRGDALGLFTALENIVSNAVKYTRSGTSVAVTGERDPATGDLRVRIADEGPGMTADEARNVFEPFARGLGSKRTGQRGTGLGLPLSRNLVTLHGGRIEVESQVGLGTAFTVVLPAARVLPPLAVPTPAAEPAPVY